MKHYKIKTICVFLIPIFFILANNCFALGKAPPKEPPQYKQNEILVKFVEGATETEKEIARKAVNANFLKELKGIKVELWQLEGEYPVEEAIEILNKLNSVEYAEPNHTYKPQIIPNDTSFNKQWYLRNTGQLVNGLRGKAGADISIVDAWDIETGNPDLIIAVIDSGHPVDHPDFKNNTWVNTAEFNGKLGIDDDHNGYVDDISGWDFANNLPTVNDFSRKYDGSGGHGGHVAGIIAAEGNNGTGVSGVMWDAKIMAVKIFDDFTYAIIHPPAASTLAEAIYYAVSNGAKIINLSLGSYSYNQSVFNIISLANDNNVLVVCAAGNDTLNTDSTPIYPAGYNLPNIISVAATDELDNIASYSNYGLNTVDVAAPGGSGLKYNIFSTLPPEREVFFFEDFESGGDNWNVNYNYEPWSFIYDYFWGSNVASDSLFNYSDNENSSITTNQKIIVPPLCFGFHTYYQIQYSLEYLYDYAYIKISFDGTNYDTIQTYTGFSNGIETIQEYYPFLGEDIPSFYLRFGITSNSSINYDGVKLDYFLLSCVPWEYHGNEYGYLSGTSMAAPVVSGVAGLIWSKYPELTHLQVKDAILNSVDPLDSLNGKVTTGGRVNALAALEMAALLITDSDGDDASNTPSSGGGGGGGGIFGDILKSSVIGYHLDGWAPEGVEIYMPVTKGFKALKGAQEYVRSFAPNLAEFVREYFDSLEKRADSNKDGFLYQIGTHIFPILGKIAEDGLELIGEEEYMNNAYSKTTISVDKFKTLEGKGLAVAPKIVRDSQNQEEIFTSLVN